MGEQEQGANLRWGEIEAPEVRVQNASEIGCVRNGDYLTLLLPGRQIVLREASEPLELAWVSTLRLPVTLASNRGLAGYLITIRGYAASSEGARISIVFDIAGATRAVQHAYDEAQDGAFTCQLFSNGGSPDWDVDADLALAEGGPANPAGVAGPTVDLFPFTVNIVAFACRRSAQETAELEITSVDVRAIIDQRPDPGSPADGKHSDA